MAIKQLRNIPAHWFLSPLYLGRGDTTSSQLAEGQILPSLKGSVDQNGNVLTLLGTGAEAFVVLSFVASWCPMSQRKVVALNKLADHFSSLRFIALHIATDLNQAQCFAQRHIHSERIVRAFDQSGCTLARFSPAALPTTYLVSRKKKVLHIHQGYSEGDDAKIAKRIGSLLQEDTLR